MREIDWSRAITCVCPCIFEKIGCHVQGKQISVFASALCWSAEPLKVALRVKNDFTSVCHYIFLWMNQRFECVVEWTVKDSLKDSLLPPPCGETMKLHWLTRTRRWNINRRSLYIYIYDFIVKFVFCYVDIILSLSSVYFTSGFNAI